MVQFNIETTKILDISMDSNNELCFIEKNINSIIFVLRDINYETHWLHKLIDYALHENFAYIVTDSTSFIEKDESEKEIKVREISLEIYGIDDNQALRIIKYIGKLVKEGVIHD